MSGVTSSGFVPATIEDIVAEVTADLRAEIDPAINLEPAQPLGQIIGALAKPVAEAWEVAQVLANVLNPNAAEGVLLENACSITGTKRDGATYSLVTATLALGSSKTVPAGSIVAVAGQPTNRWILLGPPDVHGVAVPGPVVSTAAGDYPGVFRAETTGPNVANAGTLTVIVSTVSGWSAISNAEDAAPGQTSESDVHLRQKRRAELAVAGASTPDAIRGELLELTGMVEVRVYENLESATDADGRPQGGIEAVIYDGVTPAVDDAAIAPVLWRNRSGGPTYGLTSTTVLDSIGVTRSVSFTRATGVEVSVAIDVEIDSSQFPADGVAQIKAAIVAKALEAAKVGGTVYPLTFMSAVTSAVKGIANITSYLHGRTATTGATLSTSLPFTVREIAQFDTSRIVVTTS